MTDRERLHLRGAVQAAALHQPPNAFGGEQFEAWEFDPGGRCARYRGRSGSGQEWDVRSTGPETSVFDRATVKTRAADGSRTETHELFQGERVVDGWSMDGLHDVALPTHGARLAVTRFDPQGRPVKTWLRTDAEDIAEIAYHCDADGRIVQAVQYSPTDTVFGTPEQIAEIGDAAVLSAAAGTELVRATFEYDDEGRLIVQTLSLMGHETTTRYTYNAQGDVATSTAAHEGRVQYDYGYDLQQNWVARKVHHAGGVDIQTRELAYYPAS